ncbi:MAG: DUF362 domain-containing protein [Candidatus Lokiarchaeota archaeon]|nr:DUF362 domain-containing protein [Candidatus Lokiarchaeota archaeon]
MKSKVFYFTARTHTYKESMSKYKAPLALEKIGIKERVAPSDKVVVKTHFGAEENVRYIRPSYIRFLCDYLKDLGAIPSVAESCGWGLPGAKGEYGGRANEAEYLEVALKHGYTDETMGCPILMLDGPNGIDYEIQNIKGKKFNEIFVAGRLREFDKMILATHFKGHSGTGFGGAIKNLGIGCVSKGGKVQAHNGKKFVMKTELCKPNCRKCVEICPTGALTKTNGNIKRDANTCRYCYMCTSICDEKVIDIGNSTGKEFIAQMIDNAKGVVEYFGNENIFYINYAIDITYQCDCTGGSDVPFVSDIGILSSSDPVAIDQASIDLIHLSYMNPHSILSEINGLSLNEKDTWFSYIPRFDPRTDEMDLNKEGNVSEIWDLQLKLAENIGLGSRNYELVEIHIQE